MGVTEHNSGRPERCLPLTRSRHRAIRQVLTKALGTGSGEKVAVLEFVASSMMSAAATWETKEKEPSG